MGTYQLEKNRSAIVSNIKTKKVNIILSNSVIFHVPSANVFRNNNRIKVVPQSNFNTAFKQCNGLK